VSERDLE
jgi:hypothetical protein